MAKTNIVRAVRVEIAKLLSGPDIALLLLCAQSTLACSSLRHLSLNGEIDGPVKKLLQGLGDARHVLRRSFFFVGDLSKQKQRAARELR